MVEWSITAVLKTAALRGAGGSNPSLSAHNEWNQLKISWFHFFILLAAPPDYSPFSCHIAFSGRVDKKEDGFTLKKRQDGQKVG